MPRIPAVALAVALTPALLVVPTVTPKQDSPHPVKPHVITADVAGVDPAALPAAPDAVPAGDPAGPAIAGHRKRQRPASLTGERHSDHFTLAGVTWAADSAVAADQISVQMRLRENGHWTEWEKLTVPDIAPDATSSEARLGSARIGTSPLVTDGADGYQVRVDTPTGVAPRDLKVTLVDGGTSAADDNLMPAAPASSAYAAGSQPAIITRAQWGADESLRGTPTYNSTVKAIFVHHTATSNSYSSSTAAAQIRSIYAYDTKGLGWSDIAYNFIVDKYGRIYEGRAGSITRAVRSAATGGFNVDTMGVSALGNYDTVAAPSALVTGISKVVGWKLAQYGRNPYGTAVLTSEGGGTARWAAGVSHTFDVISGHRDSGLTACPGRYLYPKLPSVRSAAVTYGKLYAPAPTVAPTPVPQERPTQEFTAADILNGGANVDMLAIDRGHQRIFFYPGAGNGYFGRRTGLMSGWGTRTLVTGVGDVDGDNIPDVLAVTPRDGRLWLYAGNGVGGLKTGRVIGNGGWQVYSQLAGVGDMNGDGHNDLIAVDRSTGNLYYYRGTGTASFSSRRQVGHGWIGYDLVTGVGDVTGDGFPDLVARTRADGRLWIYPGMSGGRWQTAQVVSSGWGNVTDLAGVGDLNNDGHNDILAVNRSANALLLYRTNGKSGFYGTIKLGTGWGNYDLVG